MTWLSEEPALPVVAIEQLGRISNRARQRVWVLLGLTLVVAAILFAIQTRRPKRFRAEIGLVVNEGVLADEGRPRPRGELRAFIENAVFVTARLEKLVNDFDLRARFGGVSMSDAVAMVRMRIDVDVWQDYFESYRRSTDPPRSARVNIAFEGQDPELALAVARELGGLVAETQAAREAEAAAARVEELRALSNGTASRAASRREQLDRDRESALSGPNGGWEFRLRRRAESVRTADDAARAAAGRLFDAQLTNLELHNARRLVKVIDPGVSMWHALPRRDRMLRQGASSLLVAFLVSVIVVGVFDPTVRDERDLLHAGLAPMGRLLVSPDRHHRLDV